jgi:hypothetical protein
VLQLDAATVLLQWAVGGLLFLWVTTRRREVGIGYGWLLRGTYLLMAVGAVVVGVWLDPVPVREVSSGAVALAAACALGVSIVRRKAGVQGERERQARKAARVRAMTGRTGSEEADEVDDEDVANPTGYAETGIERRRSGPDAALPEFPPRLDLIAPLVGIPGLIAAGIAAGDPALLSVARILAGTAFLGAVSDAMLLGHWYLVQPGLSRAPLLDLVRWTARTWPVEVAVMLWPVGMVSVLNGSIDDGWDGLLGWFWVACAVTTIVLVAVTRAALRERYYSAVMAATGLLYLAILTAFGTDLVARALL